MSKQIQKYSEPKIKEWLVKKEPDIRLTAIKKYDSNELINSALMSISESDKLKECLDSEVGAHSLVNALRYATNVGLSLNPQEGKAALVPYNKKVGNDWFATAAYQIQKNGLIELALRSGRVEEMPPPEVICDNDEFQIERTSKGDSFVFRPALKERGDAIGYMACVVLKTGKQYVKYMTKEQMLEHREKYASMYKDRNGKELSGAAWVKSFDGMALKTVVKALLNNLHLSAEIDRAIGAENEILVVEGPAEIVPPTGAQEIAQEMDDDGDPGPEPPIDVDRQQKMGDIV